MSAKGYLTEREQAEQSRVGDTYVSKGTTSRNEAVPVSRTNTRRHEQHRPGGSDRYAASRPAFGWVA